MEARDKPRMTGGSHPLPFEKLAPLEFERLCLWLVRREGYERSEYLGEAGSDHGRDVVAWKDGRRVVFQCKRVRAFSAALAKQEIEKLRALPIEDQPHELVFVVSRSVSAELRAAIRTAWGDDGTCQFWVGNELDERVKRHPEILREFFQLPPSTKQGLWLKWGVGFSVVGVVIVLAVAVAGPKIQLVARDVEERPLPGLRFAYAGVETRTTNVTGATEIDLPPFHWVGHPIKIQLLPSAKKSDDWFLVNPQINIPGGSAPAELILMRRTAFRKLAGAARDAAGPALGSKELTAVDKEWVVVEVAARYGLSAEQLETALRSFAETQDPNDQGIAAYLGGQYAKAEGLLEGAATKKEEGLVETLRYLGASQYLQAKYQAAAVTFRKAVALRPDDAGLLSWLGASLIALADWTEAEPVLRRALAISRKSYGPDNPDVTNHLNNLAALLQATNRLAEAEPLMRRALAIDEKSYGPDHPEVATDLNTLASLLQDTNRLAEAEPLERRALAIDEKSYGLDHPKVAIRLNNLAQLLQHTNRLAEAEPLMRRALAIAEKSYGPDHPNVATDLNNLALLLQATNRLAEAEPLMRRSVAIDEQCYGPDHPDVGRDLHNLATVLKVTNRLAEAEPLMRRALAIAEKSYGLDHPKVAEALNNLAQLLKATNRLAEAEPLMRRALAIFLEFGRRTGHDHPKLRATRANYAALLEKTGKSPAEAEAAIESLTTSPQE